MGWSVRMSLPLSLAGFFLLASGGASPQGTEFNLSCSANEVLVGISGRQGWWMDGVAARCRTVQENGELGETVRSTAYTGGTVNTLRTFDCKPVEVMVGYGGSQGDNGYVLHVHEILCAPWQPDTRTAKTPARTARAFEKKTGSGERIAESCLAGRVGTRLRGRAGQYLDRLIDIGCSYAAGAKPIHYPNVQKESPK